MLNEIDNNIFDHLTGGILIRDTNNVIIAYNLFLDCKEVCVDTVSGINGPRPVGGHTNDVHNLMVHDNVFFKMGRSAIEFNNARNEADGNVYPAAASPFGGAPFLRVKFPEPAEWHNLESWREEYGWDKNGAMAADHGGARSGQTGTDASREGRCEARPCLQGHRRGLLRQAVTGDKNARTVRGSLYGLSNSQR